MIEDSGAVLLIWGKIDLDLNFLYLTTLSHADKYVFYTWRNYAPDIKILEIL